jgi:hypothetical protein
VQAEHEFEPEVRWPRQGARGIVTVRFGKDGTQLMQFGFTRANRARRRHGRRARHRMARFALSESRQNPKNVNLT